MAIEPRHPVDSVDPAQPNANVHPAQRPAEPDHPMSLNGDVVPGDPRLMATCMIEELLMLGMDVDELRAMTRSPQFQAFHAARCALGDPMMDALVDDAVRRIGSLRRRTREHTGDVQGVTLTIGRS